MRVCQTDWEFSSKDLVYQEKLKIKTNPSLWVTELLDYLQAGVTCLKVPGRDRSVELVVDPTRLYRRVVDDILSCDHPNLEKYTPQVEALRVRWKQERGSRDERQIAAALASSLQNSASMANDLDYRNRA